MITMPVIYPEGGMPGLLLKQKRAEKPGAIDTFKVQLVPLRAAPTAKISRPEDVAGLVREMEDYDRESAKIIHLDTKNQVMGVETISIGSLSASIVHPRETVKGAILNNSANVIFLHNHPSGVCEPSNEDVQITGILKEAFETVGITLLDSVIVGKGCYYSLRETGLFTPKTESGMISGTVREPKASQETKGKVDFITAMTDYITAPDLIRRKRAAEKIQVSKYFKPWFDEFFYEHDRESAKQKLMKFFAANEQGLGLVNHTYYSVLTGYLNAISKPVAAGLMVRERTGAEVEIKHEPGKIFPWRVVYAGTDKTVQTREYPEAMAYYTEREAELGIAEEGLTLVKKGLEDVIYEYIKNKPDVDSVDIVSHFKLRQDITLNALAQLVKDHKVERKWLGFRYGYIPLTEQKLPSTVSENIPNNRELRKGFERVCDSKDVNNVQSFLASRTVDTSKHSRSNPVPGSVIIGAAVPEDGYLAAYHITDDPEGVIRMLRSTSVLTEQTTVDDMGSGFYVSGVPQYWNVRSREKWDFAKNLSRAQRQALVNVILSDPNYRKGGGYLADFEVDYLNRDLKLFVETGDVNILASTGSQPYNVEITADMARKAGVPVPKAPGMVKVKVQGKFINVADMYFNNEIGNRAREWAGSLEGRKKIAQWFVAVTPKNIVNAWMRSMGYSGAFTKSGFSTNPEMVIWDRRAIVDAWIPEPQT